MKGSLKLGKLFNVPIEIHWTFIFILIWVVFSEIKNGGTIENALMSVVFVLLLFVCVVLHEFGHILTARKFGVKTKRITLLPIGGMASMDKIPEKPKQELLVAVAGPAVNIVVATILLLFLPLDWLVQLDQAELETLLLHIDIQNLLIYLLAANMMLALFNFIPAFPMDGGRIFRALLAMKIGRVKATRIATIVGQFLAIVFFFIGLFYNPFLILIALFIFIGAYGENEFVQQEAVTKGHRVKEAMLTNLSVLRPDDTVARVIELLLSGTEKDFVVADKDEIHGVLYQKDIIDHVKDGGTPVKDIMDVSFKSISQNANLSDVLKLINVKRKNFFPVLDEGKLVGAIDLTNLSEFILIQSQLMKNEKSWNQ